MADSNRRLSPRAAVDSLMQVSCSYIFVSVKQILIWKSWIREYTFVSFDKKMSDLSQCLNVVHSCTLVLRSGRFWPAQHLAYPPYRLHPVRSGLVHHSLAVLTLRVSAIGSLCDHFDFVGSVAVLHVYWEMQASVQGWGCLSLPVHPTLPFSVLPCLPGMLFNLYFGFSFIEWFDKENSTTETLAMVSVVSS